MNKILNEMAATSDGLSTRCDGCKYSCHLTEKGGICSVCSVSYREGYIKGYKAKARKNGTSKASKNDR